MAESIERRGREIADTYFPRGDAPATAREIAIAGIKAGREMVAAERYAEVAMLRSSLIRACNATDGVCADTSSSEFLAGVGEEVEACIGKLRARVKEIETALTTAREWVVGPASGDHPAPDIARSDMAMIDRALKGNSHAAE